MARKLKQSWILAYAAGIDPFTEAPTAFCLWSAISVIGAVLKQNIWRKRGTFTIYPNQYIVLTGPPGIGKGEAIHPVYNIAKDLNLINIISDRITAPKIIERMAQGFAPVSIASVNGAIKTQKDSTAVLFSTELQSLLSSSDWMLQFLCDAWDKNSYEYDTKNQGTSNITGMCTSLMGACVPEYIRKLNKDAVAAVNGGFTARSIFVYAEAPSKRLPELPSIEDSKAGRQLIEDLKADLQDIATLKGEMVMSPGAQILFNHFYTNIRILDNDSDVVMHFKRRMPVHVIKLAMIFSASYSNNLIIDKVDMQNAIGSLTKVLANLDKAFRGVGESELAESTDKIQSYIERKGYTTRSEILSNMHRHVTLENLDRILLLFRTTGVIKEVTIGNKQMLQYINPNTGGSKASGIVDTTIKNIGQI